MKLHDAGPSVLVTDPQMSSIWRRQNSKPKSINQNWSNSNQADAVAILSPIGHADAAGLRAQAVPKKPFMHWTQSAERIEPPESLGQFLTDHFPSPFED